ncbi:hypothetical protein BDY24DRAFT_401352 [Mrakia frigida]|uniref:zinc finger MYND domain-containing protein n=1 Tax=Mrakia frigida TaxID=29902 RepID=UPI003FCC16E9
MPSLTVDEIASSLGLKDDSYRRMIDEYGAVESKRLVDDSVRRREESEGRRRDAMIWNWVSEGEDEIYTQFAHLYLPHLEAAHRLAIEHVVNNPWTLAFFNLSMVPIYGRLARTGSFAVDNLDLVCKQLATRLLSFSQTCDFTLTRFHPPSAFSSFLGTILSFSIFPSDGRYPAPQLNLPNGPALADRLSQIRSEIQQTSRSFLALDLQDRDQVSHLVHLMVMVEDLLNGGRLLEEEHEGLIGHARTLRWFRCGGAETDGKPCRRMKEGEEMSTCAKCRGIRYCCREHQRAHWKIHKKMCWEPIW